MLTSRREPLIRSIIRRVKGRAPGRTEAAKDSFPNSDSTRLRVETVLLEKAERTSSSSFFLLDEIERVRSTESITMPRNSIA